MGFNLIWYGSYLSFPLFGEDGAANYSFLVETLRYAQVPSLRFPIKWLEGLGQVNMFVTVTFDPFSWLMLSGLGEANAFRLSYALRATVCWLTTYAFVRSAFRWPSAMAAMSASLGMLMSFTLATIRGIPTFAGIFVATQLAIWPGLLWLYQRLAVSRELLSWIDGAFALALTLFLLVHPLGSVIGLVALCFYGIGIAAVGRHEAGRAARRAVVKLMIVSSVILFTPAIGLYHAWWAVARVSARQVFAGELTTYSREYLPPYLWTHVPLVVRLIVLLALAVMLVWRRWPRPLRAMAATVALVVGVSQVATVARAYGMADGMLERLPRPFYLEFYLPVFYAIGATYVLYRWRRLCSSAGRALPAWTLGLRLDLAVVGASWLGAYIVRFYVVGPPIVTEDIPGLGDYVLVLPVVAWVWSVGLRTFDSDVSCSSGSAWRDWLGVAKAAVASNVAIALILFSVFAGVHYSSAVVGYFALLSTVSVGMVRRTVGAHPHTRTPLGTVTIVGFAVCTWVILGPKKAFLLGVVGLSAVWIGSSRFRRTMRLDAAARLVPVVAVIAAFAGMATTWQFWPENIHPLFAAELRCRQGGLWCADPPGQSMGAGANPLTEFLRSRLAVDDDFRGRADFLLVPKMALSGFPIDSDSSLTLEEFETVHGWYARAYANGVPRFRAALFRRDPSYFSYARRQELLRTMRGLAISREPTSGELPDDVIFDVLAWAERHRDRATAVGIVSAWESEDEVMSMIHERNRNFLATGNGMLLRALPFQHIPVGSSYEQALDYLYYLLWTRYMNEGVAARRSINFTSLETVWPERLALIGMRYVMARDGANPTVPPALPRILSWQGYSVYEVAGANVGDWAPKRIVFGRTLSDELRAMRSGEFNPRRDAVMAETDRGELRAGERLGTLKRSRLRITGQSLRFQASGTEGPTLAVLPFRFSHCWQARWTSRPGRVVRADLALIGVLFDDETELELTWSAGYGPLARCLVEDARLVPEGGAAGALMR